MVPESYISLRQAAEAAGSRANVLRKHNVEKWEAKGLATKDEAGGWWVDPLVIPTIIVLPKRVKKTPPPSEDGFVTIATIHHEDNHDLVETSGGQCTLPHAPPDDRDVKTLTAPKQQIYKFNSAMKKIRIKSHPDGTTEIVVDFNTSTEENDG